MGVRPQEPLDTAGGQAPPLPHEDGDAGARVRRVAQDHEDASGLRIERELAGFPALAMRDGHEAFPSGHLHIAPGERAEFLEAEPGVQQERDNRDVPDLAAALDRSTQSLLLAAIEPTWPLPRLEDGFGRTGGGPAGRRPAVRPRSGNF